MQARKKYGIKYPNLYAPPGHKNEEAFNCAQRAHQNTVEERDESLGRLREKIQQSGA